MGRFHISHIVKGDLPRVATYLEIKSGGVYTKADWTRILEWIWINNPNVTTDTILGWLILDETETIQGVLGNIAAACTVYGETKKSFWATSWFVDEEARSQSLELFMNYVKQGGLLMSNTPNPSVEKMLIKAFKYERAHSPWFGGSFLFPLKPLKDFFSKREKETGLIKRTALMGAAVVLKIPQAFVFLQRGSNKIFKQLSVKVITEFSSATDEWFREFGSHHICTMTRSSAVYNWIFCDPQNKTSFNAFEVVYEGKIQGYMVFKKKYNATSGFHYMELVDEALLPLAAEVMEQVIAKTYYAATKTATNESLLIMRSNNEPARNTMRSLLGIRIKKVEKTYYKQSFLKPGDKPFLTSVDGDSIFF